MRYATPRRRSPTDIAYAIAKAAYEGQRKTRIMYASGLNLVQLNDYLEGLSRTGMITLNADKVYFTTDKGRQFVKAYERYFETRELLIAQELILDEYWTPSGRRTRRLEALPELRA